MKTKAAILFEVGQQLDIREVEVANLRPVRCWYGWQSAGFATVIFMS